MSSDTFFEEEDKNKMDRDDFGFSDDDFGFSEDLDNFGFSDDGEEEEEDVKTTQQVLGKISVTKKFTMNGIISRSVPKSNLEFSRLDDLTSEKSCGQWYKTLLGVQGV